MKHEFKHSAAPWDTFAQSVFSNKRGYLCSLQVSDEVLLEEACANARLISAAPDLLLACIALRELGKSTKQTEAAIRKALAP